MAGPFPSVKAAAWLVVVLSSFGVLPVPSVKATHGDEASRRVSFSRDVRPIFSEACFKCHGPDRITRQAELRLDREESVFGDRDGYRIVVPGDPAGSMLIRRITSEDPEERMPPPASEVTLTADQISLIRQWIQQGAKWEKHWAYITPQRPELPDVETPSWSQNAIDDFVLARLEQSQLQPSPEADRRTLIRRLSLDLTGLPPTPDEIAAFLEDESPAAYERLVERLLASPRFGERMALPWLEASRYADTSGYQEDYGRYMYPWRTWVIDAFNSNLPFDQFVIEQMAGDLLPNATERQILATGFHRNHRINQEVGSIPEEFLVEYAVDRLETVGTVFLGTTIGCARCHDHKYDPISQREFYELYAFFNNNDELGVDQQSRFGFCKPFIEWPTDEGRQKLSALQERLEQLKGERRPSAAEQEAYERWLSQCREKPPLGLSAWHSIGPFDHEEPSTSAGFAQPFIGEPDVDLEARFGEQKWKQRPNWKDGDVQFLNGEFATYYIYREIFSPTDRPLEISFGASDAFKLWVNSEMRASRSEAGENLPKAEGISVPLKSGRNVLLVKLSNGAFNQGFVFGAGERDAVPPSVFAILQKSAEQWSSEEQAQLYDYFHKLRIAAVDQDISDLRDTFAKVMVMRERPEVRPAFVLNRGMYNDRREQVQRDTPNVLPPFPADQPRDRLGLARWLTSPQHPLLARVTVNRFWQMVFGVGLVKTTEDFGIQGEWPSHPDLLDWLAREFMDSGWDVKALVRLIVTSATYRQSSRLTPELQQRDPQNRLLARGPRFRLRPQFIRDQALIVSGLLVEKIGGPSVKPYQPEGLWREVSNLLLQQQWYNTNKYEQDHGKSLYRRSLYTFWKRTVPPPGMTIFDAGNREVCRVRSQITNTPLQALNLLNDVTYVEAARHLAHRMLTEGGDTESERLVFGMELVTSRLPSAEEMTILRNALKRHLSIYRDNPDAAKQFLSHGESANPGDHDPVVHAAYSQIGLLLLNLDQAITKQ